jgi:membrane-associated phospholipid phosphatase
MHSIKFILLLSVFTGLLLPHKIEAQTTQTTKQDSTKFVSIAKKNIVPVTLIGLGILTNNTDFEKHLQTDLRNKVGNEYELKIDNYLQYVPAIELVTADLLGIKAKNHWFDQTKYLLISQLISSSITHSLKMITDKERPNGSPFAFPSGHTTFAFTNAGVLYREFEKSSPVLAYSGYAFATTTGVFRMINNKHWASDVLVGAGIGIITTELVYHFEPLKNFNPFAKSKNLTLFPQVGNDSFNIYFAYHF